MSNRWPRGARRLLLIVLGVVVGLPAIGALYQTLSVQRDASRFPPPGRLVDVGGRRLHLLCTGEGEPTVIFEGSGLESALSFEAVRAEIGSQTRVCSYDRMGMGWSDPGPGAISAGLLADDLRLLLDRAGLHPPYILVPASIGGLTAEMFARRYPEQVVGLVFVDAADSGMLERAASILTSVEIEAACLARIAARLGVLRLIDPLRLRQQRPGTAARTIAITYRAEPMATICALLRGIRKSAQELSEAPPLAPDVPLVVLSHDKPVGLLPPGYESEAEAFEPEWRDLQQRLSRRSTRGIWRIVPNSGHLIHGSQPHAVASAVLEMLAQIRHAVRIGG